MLKLTGKCMGKFTLITNLISDVNDDWHTFTTRRHIMNKLVEYNRLMFAEFIRL
jgi:hypothetical protein